MSFGVVLSDREAIHGHFHHRWCVACGQVAGILLGKLDRGQQSIVEGNRQQAILLPFDLGQQTGGAAFEDALNAAFRGATSSPFSGDAHQHPIAVPGVVELVITDVDVFSTVVTDGETKALAAAPQPRFDQVLVMASADVAVLKNADDSQLVETVESEGQSLLFRAIGQPQDLFDFSRVK